MCLFPQQMVSKLRVVCDKSDKVFKVLWEERAKKATQTILKEGPTKMSIANSEKSHDQFQWMSMCERIMGNFFSCLAFP